MAQIMLQDAFRKAGLKHVKVLSSGLSDEEYGNPIDRRAAKTLSKNGFSSAEKHRARVLNSGDLTDVDLAIPMTTYHARALRQLATAEGVTPEIRMLRSFDPDAPVIPDVGDEYLLDVEDPWYGGQENFDECFNQLQLAIPGIVEYVKEQVK